MRETPPAVAVKLGGSLITDKRRPGSDRPEVLARLAGELTSVLGAGPSWRAGAPRVILGHGSGSFGHAAAARTGLLGADAREDAGEDADTGDRTPREDDDRDLAGGVSTTQAVAAELHRRVIAALAAAGLAPFSIAPSSALVAEDGEPVAFDAEPVALALALGLLPVGYGDVVLDRARGAAICSTETLLLTLARRLPALGQPVQRVLWLGETDGVLDAEGRTVDELRRDHPALAAVGEAAGTDVTGGMRHRVAAALDLADLGIESWIVDGTVPGRLARALAGEAVPGTRVPAAR